MLGLISSFATLLCFLTYSEAECEVAAFSTKRWDRRNRADLIESAILCHDAQVMGSYQVPS